MKNTIRNTAVATGLAALILASAPTKKAEALSFSGTQIGNFLVSGEYFDGSAQFNIQYNPLQNDSSLLYGNAVKLNDVNFGGSMSASNGWNTTSTPNVNGSKNYSLSTNGFANISDLFDFGFNYANQNGFSVPLGIENEALSGKLNLTISDAVKTYSGFIDAPYSLTNVPQNNSTVPVPEPSTMALFGAGILGLAIYGKRKMNEDINYKK